MAGELRHYGAFVRSKSCSACGTPFMIEGHHALYGTTYSPDEPIPAKSIPNARKGAAQTSHDWFLIPLCLSRCHTPGLHKLAGYFEGWSGAKLEKWEREQVEEMHKLYDAEFPNGDPALAAKTDRAAARKASGTRDPVLKERARVVRVIRARAAERQHLPDQHALLAELADDIAAGLNETGAF